MHRGREAKGVADLYEGRGNSSPLASYPHDSSSGCFPCERSPEHCALQHSTPL